LQTRRLIAGDSISLDQDKSFYCVVDGMVQVYAQTGDSKPDHQGSWDDEDMNGYQLINEVGSGGTVSSLFTILSLFTEDVKMSWQDDHLAYLESSIGSPSSHISSASTSGLSSRRGRSTTPAEVPRLDLNIPFSESPSVLSPRGRSPSEASTASTLHGVRPGNTPPRGAGFMSPPFEDDYLQVPRQEPPRLTGVNHGVVARAVEDTTLAVIPAEAFRRLTKKFPKAAGHIVQGEAHISL
jgi:lysophospholipid hydrolase